jgi:RNA-binding protein
MALSTKDKQHLKGRAHKLKPVVMVGNNGVTEAVTKEVNRALDDHELIKIRVQTEDRELRQQLFEAIRDAAEAELIQKIGSIGVYFRASKKEEVVVKKIIRKPAKKKARRRD